MIINVTELIDKRQADPNILEWFLVALMANAPKTMNGPDFDGRRVEVTMTINGVEVDFREPLQRVYNDFEKNVQEEAAKLLRRKAEETGFDFQELTNNAYRHACELYNLPETEH